MRPTQLYSFRASSTHRKSLLQRPARGGAISYNKINWSRNGYQFSCKIFTRIFASQSNTTEQRADSICLCSGHRMAGTFSYFITSCSEPQSSDLGHDKHNSLQLIHRAHLFHYTHSPTPTFTSITQNATIQAKQTFYSGISNRGGRHCHCQKWGVLEKEMRAFTQTGQDFFNHKLDFVLLCSRSCLATATLITEH